MKVTPLVINTIIGIGTVITAVVAYKVTSSPTNKDNKIKIMSVRKKLKRFKAADDMDNKSYF